MPKAPAIPERLEGLVRLPDEKAVRELLLVRSTSAAGRP